MSELAWTLSRGVAELKRSMLRDLLSLAVDPDIISLAGGLPASESLPVGALTECLDAVLRRDGPRALQYSPQVEGLREWISEYMQRRGVPCRPGQVFITNGAQQGLAILSRLFLDPGDPAVIEEITFTGVQQITVGRGAKVRPISTDLATGADMDDLEAALRRQPRPRLIVLIPDFHNPLGVSLSAEKRLRAARLAAEYGVALLEDDPYSALRFQGEALPPIKAFDEAGFVFYLGSFSKMLAPAMRLGWIVAPVELVPRITVVRESIDLESSTLIQRGVMEFLQRGWLEPHLEALNQANLERCQAMLEALEGGLSGLAHWTAPDGGLFVWVTLPEDVDALTMFASAVEHKVAYIPGTAFAVRGDHRNTLRLNFSNQSPAAIREGVSRLAGVIRQYMIG
jgi:2-aminoadipate transaminase